MLGAIAPLSLIALALLTQASYFSAGFIEDDRQHLGGAGHALAGHSSVRQYILLPHNEHVLPAWRVWYYSTWRLFGMQPLPWHVAIALSHALGAVALWGVLRRYLDFPLAAWLGAALWAGAAIGYPENPLVWIAASHLAFAVDWLFVAMYCATKIDRPHAWLWATAMGLAATWAVLWMGAVIVLIPVIAVQVLWLSPEITRRRQLAWLSVLAGVMLLTGLIQSVLLRMYATRQIEPLSSLRPLVALVKVCVQVVGAASSVAGFTLNVEALPAGAELDPLTGLGGFLRDNLMTLILPGLLGMAAVGAIVVWGGARRRRVLLWGFLPALIYFSLLHVARGNLPLATIAMWGRYYFLAVSAWCIAVALLVDLLLERAAPEDRRFYLWVVLLLFGAQWWGQFNLARGAVTEFAAKEAKNHEYDAPRDELLRALSAAAQAEQRPLRAAEMMIYDPPFLQHLSRYIEYRFPEGLPGFQIVPGQTVREEDLANLLGTLQKIDAPLARQWEGYWQASADPRRLLVELSQVATRQGHPLFVPNLSVSTPEFGIPLVRFREQVFPEGLPGVEILTADQFQPGVPWLPTISALHASRNPLARLWLEAVEQVQAATGQGQALPTN